MSTGIEADVRGGLGAARCVDLLDRREKLLPIPALDVRSLLDDERGHVDDIENF
jgi:hypothetical protein